MWPNPHKTTDSVTFTEKILNRKFHFLCCEGDGGGGGGVLSSAQELFVIRVRDNDKGYLIKDRSLFVDVFIIINFKTSKSSSILSF